MGLTGLTSAQTVQSIMQASVLEFQTIVVAVIHATTFARLTAQNSRKTDFVVDVFLN